MRRLAAQSDLHQKYGRAKFARRHTHSPDLGIRPESEFLRVGITHRAHILSRNGESYRLAQSANRRRSLARAEQNQAGTDNVDSETCEITQP